MKKTYFVARTVVYYFEVEAESEQEALFEAGEYSNDSAINQEQVTQQVVYIEEPA